MIFFKLLNCSLQSLFVLTPFLSAQILKEIANPEYREDNHKNKQIAQERPGPLQKPGLERGTLSLLSFAIGLARLGRLSHCANFLELG